MHTLIALRDEFAWELQADKREILSSTTYFSQGVLA